MSQGFADGCGDARERLHAIEFATLCVQNPQQLSSGAATRCIARSLEDRACKAAMLRGNLTAARTVRSLSMWAQAEVGDEHAANAHRHRLGNSPGSCFVSVPCKTGQFNVTYTMLIQTLQLSRPASNFSARCYTCRRQAS